MKERAFNAKPHEVRGILAGRQSQLRRVVKPQPTGIYRADYFIWSDPNVFFEIGGSLPKHKPCGGRMVRCPYGQPGDRLWVRETWAPHDQSVMRERNKSLIYYRADDERKHESDGTWKPSIHMPRWASRITLKITGVGAERLQDISEADCLAEGIQLQKLIAEPGGELGRRPEFRQLWESINGPESWQENPWVWVVEFKCVTP